MTVSINTSGPQGRTYVRALIARALAKSEFAEFAAQRWGAGQADRIAKASVPATNSDEIGTPESREFFGLAIQQSLLGRIAGLRRVPFNTRFTRQTGGAQAYWVGESNPIPLSKQSVMGSALPGLKVAGIVCATKEAVQAMGEVVEAALQADLQNAIAATLDTTFISPAWAGVADQAPASITYGQTEIPSSGDPKQDIIALLAAYTGNLRSAVIVMHPRTAVVLGLLEEPLGETKLSVQGGVIAGIPTLCTEAVPFDTNGGSITILDASAIAYGARDLLMSVATHASLAMSDDPQSPAEQVNLWQTNTIAWKVVAEANWEVQGTGRVVTIPDVDYAVGS